MAKTEAGITSRQILNIAKNALLFDDFVFCLSAGTNFSVFLLSAKTMDQ
jgi:hypothetical protein